MHHIRHLLRGGRRMAGRTAVAVTLGALPLALGACSGVTDSLLEAEDPDLITPGNVNTPAGALSVRNGALDRFRDITGGDESTWLFGGLLADEWATSSTFVQNDETDQRNIQVENSSITGMYREINRVRTASNQAIALLKEFHADSATAIAEMYFARGFAEMQLAQDFCGAIPLSDASAGLELVGPSTTIEVFETAIASYDSALALVGTATSGSAQSIARAASIGKARALMGIGRDRFAEAAALVTAIPTSYSYNHTFALSSGDNILWSQPRSSRRYNVGNNLEGNARNITVANNLDFFSANDPRLPTRYMTSNQGKDTTQSQDGSTFSRTTELYQRSTPIAVVSGLDARLIEAEAALQAGNPGLMLEILNALRAAPPEIGQYTTQNNNRLAPLPALALPATFDEQLDLLFREKAFWTFTRGQRLGDLRRLIRQYGRAPENVFPVGQHYRGGEYGDDVNLPVPQAEENNPNFDRAQCQTNVA